MSSPPRRPRAPRKRSPVQPIEAAAEAVDIKVQAVKPAAPAVKPPLKARRSKAKPQNKSDDAMVATLLAVFAHEVRTPLTGILAVSDLLATSDLQPREQRWVETIKAGAEHLANLANLFVDAAHSSHDKLELRRDFFDLQVLARNVGNSLAGRAAAKGLQAVVDISQTLPNFVVGDPVRLRAALENLVDNAIKFTNAGNVVMKVSARRSAGGRQAVVFKISDTGIGLTIAEIKNLFKPFSQANVTIAARFGGAGLGLSSVRQLAQAMGGDVSVVPRAGGGAVFTLTVVVERAAETQAAQPAVGPRGGPVGTMRVLSVEDNPFGRVVLNAILTELGYQADFIGRGEDVVDRLTQGQFDAVLMDMVLPGINGVEAIRLIRAMPSDQRHIPIVGVSGRNDDEAAARKAGANGFLIKPVSPRALAIALLEARGHGAVAT